MALVNAFGNLALESTASGVKTLLETGARVNPENIITKFREAFETFSSQHWDLVTGSGDIVQIDGNAGSASYLVISKDPFTPGVESSITSVNSFSMPVEVSVGLSMSQRTHGQEFAVEIISNETPDPVFQDVAISSLSQATTTLTVNTTAPHGLVPGKRVGIYGVTDSRFNYPNVVIASIPSPTQFTVTAGAQGTIASVTASTGAGGYVYGRQTLGGALNGTSMVLENTTATNASFFCRAAGGDSLPSGTINGNQSATITTTASTQLINSAYTYSFSPSGEYRLYLQADRIQWHDSGIDTTGLLSARYTKSQVVPDPSKTYKLRIRGTNVKGMSYPVAQIVSISKSGSTTATVNTSEPHGLTTGDYINIYGVRDQTNFANLSSQTVVASVSSSTQFTVVLGASVTATSYGGYVARVNGSNTMNNLGAVSQVVSTAAVTATELVLFGSANWSGLSIGDYINVIGCRNNTDGASLGVDGAYKVANVSTTTLNLVPIGTTTLPAAFSATNAGGGVVKRTDIRISFVRIFDYLRERVEMLPRPSGDTTLAAPIQGTVAVSSLPILTTLTTLNQLAGIPTNSTVYDIQHNNWANTVRRAVS